MQATVFEYPAQGIIDDSVLVKQRLPRKSSRANPDVVMVLGARSVAGLDRCVRQGGVDKRFDFLVSDHTRQFGAFKALALWVCPAGLGYSTVWSKPISGNR